MRVQIFSLTWSFTWKVSAWLFNSWQKIRAVLLVTYVPPKLFSTYTIALTVKLCQGNSHFGLIYIHFFDMYLKTVVTRRRWFLGTIDKRQKVLAIFFLWKGCNITQTGAGGEMSLGSGPHLTQCKYIEPSNVIRLKSSNGQHLFFSAVPTLGNHYLVLGSMKDDSDRNWIFFIAGRVTFFLLNQSRISIS